MRTSPVSGNTPRVAVRAVVQELAGALLVNPTASTAALWERPPLRLDAVVNAPRGVSQAITVINVQFQSRDGIDSLAAGTNGWATVGAEVRGRRHSQASALADLVQTRQTVNATERIAVVGGFESFLFNDGLVDVLATLRGAPVPDNQTAVPGDGADRVNPDLRLLEPAALGYSVIDRGDAAATDHVVVNDDLEENAAGVQYAHIAADFPESARNSPLTATRVSDHDPLVASFVLNQAPMADPGGPYSAPEGGSVALAANGSSDPDGTHADLRVGPRWRRHLRRDRSRRHPRRRDRRDAAVLGRRGGRAADGDREPARVRRRADRHRRPSPSA